MMSRLKAVVVTGALGSWGPPSTCPTLAVPKGSFCLINFLTYTFACSLLLILASSILILLLMLLVTAVYWGMVSLSIVLVGFYRRVEGSISLIGCEDFLILVVLEPQSSL
jgi:hypothetical protein